MAKTQIDADTHLPLLIRDHRLGLNLGQDEAAKEIGISVGYFVDIEGGLLSPQWNHIQMILRWIDRTS